MKHQYKRNQELARLIAQGKAAEKKLEPLYQAVEDGRAARKIMITENMPFAYKLAYSWSVPDAAQIALIALIEAVDKYNPDKMRSFSHFASYRIKGALKKAHESTLIKIGDNNARHTAFKNKTNSTITCYDATKSHLLLNAIRAPLGIDAAEMVSDTTLSPDEALIGAEAYITLKSEIDAALLELTTIEQLMVQSRYLNDPPVSYKSISQRYFLSIRELKSIETSAMDKLRLILG